MAQFGESFAGGLAQGFSNSFNPMIALAMQKKENEKREKSAFMLKGLEEGIGKGQAVAKMWATAAGQEYGQDAENNLKTAFDLFFKDKENSLQSYLGDLKPEQQTNAISTFLDTGNMKAFLDTVTKFKGENLIKEMNTKLSSFSKVPADQRRYPTGAEPSGTGRVESKLHPAYLKLSQMEDKETIAIPAQSLLQTYNWALEKAVAQELSPAVIENIKNKISYIEKIAEKETDASFHITGDKGIIILNKLGKEIGNILTPQTEVLRKAEADVASVKAKNAEQVIQSEQDRTKADIRKTNAEAALLERQLGLYDFYSKFDKAAAAKVMKIDISGKDSDKAFTELDKATGVMRKVIESQSMGMPYTAQQFEEWMQIPTFAKQFTEAQKITQAAFDKYIPEIAKTQGANEKDIELSSIIAAKLKEKKLKLESVSQIQAYLKNNNLQGYNAQSIYNEVIRILNKK